MELISESAPGTCCKMLLFGKKNHKMNITSTAQVSIIQGIREQPAHFEHS